MRHILSSLLLMMAIFAMSATAEADPSALNVTVTYRERIALPPDAQLDVQLLDTSRPGAGAQRIATQRFAMTKVPETVTLTYDPQVIGDPSTYAIVASIWSGDIRIFRTTDRHDAFGDTPIKITLSRVMMEDMDTSLPRPISGIAWAVTEINGTAWANNDPATLMIDSDGGVSAFGGCNRFNGALLPSDTGIAFPQHFAATKMACPNDIEASERAFITALGRVSDYVRYGSGLVMTDVDGNAVLHFVERPD